MPIKSIKRFSELPEKFSGEQQTPVPIVRLPNQDTNQLSRTQKTLDVIRGGGRKRYSKKKKEEEKLRKQHKPITKYFQKEERLIRSLSGKRKLESSSPEENKVQKVGKSDYKSDEN